MCDLNERPDPQEFFNARRNNLTLSKADEHAIDEIMDNFQPVEEVEVRLKLNSELVERIIKAASKSRIPMDQYIQEALQGSRGQSKP